MNNVYDINNPFEREIKGTQSCRVTYTQNLKEEIVIDSIILIINHCGFSIQ